MKHIAKRILSFFFAVCMLLSSIGDLTLLVFAEENTAPTLELTATVEETYEVTASFAVDVPEGWTGSDTEYVDYLGNSITLDVHEITMPEETENTPETLENSTGTPDQTTPTEDGQNGNGTDASEGEGTTMPETGGPSGETGGEDTPNNSGNETGTKPEAEPPYEDYVNQTMETLKLQDSALVDARVLGISLRDSTGSDYHPTGAVEVSVEFLREEDRITYLDNDKWPDVVLIPQDDDADPQILSGTVTVESGAVKFQTESLSTFVLAATTREQTLASGSVTVTYAYDNASESGIPSYAELEVSELTEGSDAYSEAVASATAAVSGKPGMLALTKPFDITLANPETRDKYQTEQPVQISIQFDNLSDYKSVYVVHIHDDLAEVITPTESGNSVTFTANGLSVFVLCAFTDYTYTITGGSEVALSTLFEELDITEIALNNVTSVSFSKQESVTVEQTESGWMLKSVAPFDTTETLTIAAGDTTVAIKVTYEEQETVITPPAAREGLVYNGEAQELITAGSVSDGSAMLYSLSAEGEYSEAIPTAKNAGSYTIYYKAENQETEPDSLEVKIEEKALVITAASDSKVYDGYVLSNSGYTADGLASGDVIQSITAEGEQIDVNASGDPSETIPPNNAVRDAIIVDAQGTVVTGNYSITYMPGTLKVTKKPITITAESAEKVYDGTALTATGYTSTGLADGDSFDSVTVDGSQTVVGQSDNVPSNAVIVRPTEESAVYVTNNYDITYENGTLKVTGKKLTITADSESKVYDGTALTKATYTVEGLAEGDSVQSVKVTGSQTNVGESANVPSEATIVNADGEDVTADYTIVYKNGTLEVTKKPVKLTAASGVQVYDGSVKTVTGFTVSADGRNLGNITFSDTVSATGSGTEKGTYDVTFSGVTLNDTEDVTGNYVVAETEDGVLHITNAAPITKELTGFNGNEATYKIVVNPDSLTLNNGSSLTLKDTFTNNQSIDYGSVTVQGADVPYDYSGYTGTFTIPDARCVTITYKTRVSGAAGTVATFGNTAELGITQYGTFASWYSATVSETRTVTPTGTDIEGSNGYYYIKLFTYAQNHMDQGLGGAVFRLLDSNQRPIAYRAGDHAGEIVTYTTDVNGYVNVELDDGIISLHKNTVYYLEMITAPVAHNPDGTYTYYQKDNTLYSFLIADDPSYSAGGGIYTYFNGDVLKVRCYSEAAGINVTKRFSGNYSLTDEQKNQIRFVLQKENLATEGWDDIESHTYAEFLYDSINFEAGKAGGPPLEQAVLYRVIEENDALEDIDHSRSVMLFYQRDNEPIQENTNEFQVSPDHNTYSFSLVFDNSYVDHKLTVVKLNELTGQRLPGAEFTVYSALDDQQVKTYTTGAEGSLVIRRGDEGANYASNTAYYVVETQQPAGYLKPKNPEKLYFYFSEDGSGVPAGIPTGTTAVDLSVSFDTVTVANHTETVTVPVTVTWAVDGSSTWPSDVDFVEIGLYQSVNGSLPVPTRREGIDMTLRLNRDKTYDNTTFAGLPARDEDGNDITYSVVQKEQDALSGYYTSYKVSGTGWYVVRNESAVSVIVVKEWYDLDGNPVPVANTYDKLPVAFDLYRTTTDNTSITARDDLETFLRGLEPVRTNLVLYADNGWSNTVSSLQKQNEAGQLYYYFAVERENSMPRNNEDSYAIVPARDGSLRTLTIKNTQTPITVIIRAQDLSKQYGQDDPAFTFYTEVQDDRCSVGQPVAGEDGNYIVTVTHGAETKQITFTCSREEGEDVGSYAIALTGEASQQGYRVRLDNGTLTINPAQVTVTGTATKVYGDPDPSLVKITGLKEGDTISYYAYRDVGEQKGSYRIYVTGLEKQGNYEITYINDYLTIKPAPVTVTADNISKAYGQTDPRLTVSIDGLKNNDAASVIKYTISRAEGESVGEYPITVTGDENQGNYVVTFVNGTFTITGHKVTVRAKNYIKTYGDADPAWDAEVTGLAEGETIDYTFTRQEGEDVGTYVITPSGAAHQGNAEVTFETGILTINRANLTVKPVNIIKALTDPITPDPQLTVNFDKLVNHDDEITPTAVYDEGTRTWTYTYTREGKPTPEFGFTITRTPGETAGPYIIAATAFGERPKNYNITYQTGIFTILTTYNVVVNQQTRDMVDFAQNPEYEYTATLDLSGIGIDNYTEQGFDNNKLTFTLPAEDVSSKTLPIPSGAKLTLTQNTTNPDYTTAITLDGNDVQGTSVEINPVSKSAAIVVTHNRITLPVEARAAQRQTPEGKADEDGAVAVTPLAYLGIPRNAEGNTVPQTAADFIAALDAQGVYNLPEDMYYVPEHASVYNGIELVAKNVQAIRYDEEASVWQYSLDNTNFTAFQAGEQLELFYMPQYICRVQADGELFYTLNSALNHIRDTDTYNGTGVIEMLIDRYTMPAADNLTIPRDFNITLTTAEGVAKATILRKPNNLDHMLTNEGTLTLGNITLDGNKSRVTANDAMVLNKGTLTVSGGATLQNAKGNNGGALYANAGSVTVESDAIFTQNSATNGGAIYFNGGSLSIATDITGNSATNGGAVYITDTNSATLTLTGTLSGNFADNGGAVYLAGGTLDVSGSLTGNTANNGNGGAVFIARGTLNLTDGTVQRNNAMSGGAVYLAGGTLNQSGGSLTGNTANNGNGGAIYSSNAVVNITGGSITDNIAPDGNGGALYLASGAASIGGAAVQGNIAGGNGGAVCQAGGTLTVTGTIDGENKAQNGAAVYVLRGSATFNGCNITGNIATAGGAIGVGSADARLHFAGDAKVTGNTVENEQRNLYLDQDTDLVINTASLGADANIGVRVAENLVTTRGDAGCAFGTYTGNSNLSKFKNDVNTGLTACENNYKIIWSKGISVQVVRLNTYSSATNFPPKAAGSNITSFTYYPKSRTNNIYDLVMEMYNAKYKASITGDDLYAYSFATTAEQFEQFLSAINWNSANQRWDFVENNGNTATGTPNLKVYYSQGAYISIVNNSEYDLTVDSMTVLGKNVPVYGYPTVKNNITLDTLAPVTTEDLVLKSGENVKLLFPGAVNKAWFLTGTFTDPETGAHVGNTSYWYTIDRTHGGTPHEGTTDANGSFTHNGYTNNTAGGTIEVLFGNPTNICKVVDGNGEHPFPTLNAAWNYIVDNGLTYTYTKDDGTTVTKPGGTIEMLVDYLQPLSDVLNINEASFTDRGKPYDGYCLKLTTAATSDVQYPYVGQEGATRATISRDSDNGGAAVIAMPYKKTKAATETECDAFLIVDNLTFDGKALAKKGNGGAISTANNVVKITNCDFKGYQAVRGGAVFVAWGALTVDGCTFSNCNTGDNSGDKLGGGGIWTSAQNLVVKNSDFDTCACIIGNSQGGGVFHNIRQPGKSIYENGDSNLFAKFPDGYSLSSSTWLENCHFTNCYSLGGSGGTMETDSMVVTIDGCWFEGSYSNKNNANGGAINILHNDAFEATTVYPNASLTVRDSTFKDCVTNTGASYGGAICDQNSVKTEIVNCDFINCSANTGGAIVTNRKAKVPLDIKTELPDGITVSILGSRFENCTARGEGGAVHTTTTKLTISNTYKDDHGQNATADAWFKDCSAPNYGGVYQNGIVVGSEVTVSNVYFANCSSNTGNAGALMVNARSLTVTDTARRENENDPYTFTDCTAGKSGGGIYHSPQNTVKDTLKDVSFYHCSAKAEGGGARLASAAIEISGAEVRNCEAVTNGGGIYVQGATTMENCVFSGNKATGETGCGGSIYINSGTVGITGGSISDSIAVNGGGIYNKGTLTVSKGTEENSGTITNCAAKTSGGGIYTTNRLTLDGATISDCYAVTSGGGIYHNGNNLYPYGTITKCYAEQGGGVYSNTYIEMKDATKTAEISDCHAATVTIAADGTASAEKEYLAANLGGGVYKSGGSWNMESATATISGCSAYDGGGVYYNSTGTLTYTAGNFYGNTATNNGGAIYKNAGTVNMTGSGVIGGSAENANHAQFGAAIFVADGQKITIGGGRITHNVAEEGGAVAVGGSNANTQLLFQGAPVIKNNTLSSGVKCNVFLNYDSNGIIRTSGTALAAGAYIGVYVTDEQFARHGDYGMPFGTYNKTDSLGSFFNDRIYAGGLKGSSNNQIVWGEFVCKITDSDGNLLYTDTTRETPAIYMTLENNGAENTSSAFGMISYASPKLYNADGQYSRAYQIQMLVGEYSCTNQIKLKNGSKDVTLTTASRTPDEFGFCYTGAADQAVIRRGANYGSMIDTTNMSKLTIENITIDGGSENGWKSTAKGGIMYLTGGTQVYLEQNATLCNSNSQGYNGAGIRMEGSNNSKLFIDGAVIRNCVCTVYGGAISGKNGDITMNSGLITECSAAYGAGIVVERHMDMNGGTITGNRATAEGGGVNIRPGGSVHFSGDPVISGNTLNGTPCNLHLINDNNTSIYADGLGPFAEIRVYTSSGTIRDKHGGAADPFGTWTNNSNLHCFINDVTPTLRGMKTTDNTLIYWRESAFLSVGKLVESDWAEDKNVEFHFTVTLIKPDQSGTYDFSGNYEHMYFERGIANFTLKAGEVRTAVGLPYNLIHEGVRYTITENLPEGHDYTTQYRQNDGTPVTGTSVDGLFGENLNDTLTSSTLSSVIFTNTRKKNDLTVSKTVTDGNPGDNTLPFEFTVTLDDNTINKSYDAKLSQDDRTTDMTVTFVGGVGTFQLTDGQSIQILDLPKNLDFEVKENLTEEQSGDFRTYVTAGSTEETQTSSARGKIGELVTVAFRNNRYGLVCKIVNGTERREQLYYRENDQLELDPTPAIFDELEKAFKTISDGISFFTAEGSAADTNLRIEMVKPLYTMKEQATLAENYNVTLGTALKTDRLYPYPTDADSPAVVTRGYNGGSMIADNGNLTLDSIILDGNGENYTADQNGGIVRVNGTQTLTVTNQATLRNSVSSADGGAIWIGSNARLEMNGTITSCRAENGGGVYAFKDFGGRTGTVGVNVSGVISDCTADDSGGALYAEATASIVGDAVPISLTGSAHLTGNQAQNGGAIYSAANVEIKNSVSVSISGNTASTDGGGLYLASGASLNMTDGAVSGNTATNGNGGGVWGQNIALTGSIFSENKAEKGYGGAIFTNPGTTVTIGSDTSFTDNQAKQGGAVYAQAASLSMTAGSMTGNSATVSGGAVYVVDGRSFTMSGGEIRGNSSPKGAVSTGEGAALHFSGNATVTNNTNGSPSEPVAMNVYLGYHSNTVINAADLSGSGQIGVYVADGEDHLIYNNHGIANRPFGTGSGEHLDEFVNDRDNTLTGVSGPGGLIMWPGKNLVIQVNQYKDKTTPVGGARFSLASEAGLTLWTGDSNAATSLLPGQITIPWGSTETEDCQHAAFAKWKAGEAGAEASVIPVSYILTQLQANADTVRPAGTWKLTVGTDNTVTWEVIEPTDAEGKPVSEVNRTLQLEPASGGYLGDTFLLYNDVKPTITFDPDGGILYGGTDTSSRTDTIGFKSTELNYSYKITERSPTKENAVFRAWFDGTKEYSQNDVILFYRHSDNDDVTLKALWTTVVCKITDREDNLLYVNGSPAVYMSLKAGFDAFNKEHFTLRNGSNATPRKIKMLVDSYQMTESVELARNMIAELTTAPLTDTDGYAGPGSPCVITRASSFNTGSMIVDNYSLSIRNLILDGNGGATTMEGDGGIVKVLGRASNLTLTSGATLRNARVSGKGGAIYAESTTTVTVSSGSAITGCYAQQGGAIYGYTVNVNGGTIGGQEEYLRNYAIAIDENAARGGAIYAAGSMNMTGGNITGNYATATATDATGQGGAVYAVGSMNMTGGRITGNRADYGGGVYSNNMVIISNSSAVISGNTAWKDGGGLYIGGEGTLRLSAGSIGADGSPNDAYRGSGVYLAGAAKLSGGSISYNGNNGNNGNNVYGGGLYLDTTQKVTLEGTRLSQNLATDGGGLYANAVRDLTLTSGTISGNTASSRGGGIYLSRSLHFQMTGGSLSGNNAYLGGGVYVGIDGGEMTLSGGTVERNTSANGAGIYVDSSALRVESGAIRDNSATAYGGAVYLQGSGQLHASGGTITGNSAGNADGGAINAEGSDARIYLSGSPTIFNNPGNAANTQQKNLVLSQAQNDIINTEARGLTDKQTRGIEGMIGIYVIDGPSQSVYTQHGVYGKPFGTFGGTDENRVNAKNLVNDRNLGLYGVKKEDDNTIYWQDVVCKVTNANDEMLYKLVNVDNSGVQVYVPAVYTSLIDGLNAIRGSLFRKTGSRYATANTGAVKVKMLLDYTLDEREIITYTTPRNVTVTTAETEITTTMLNSGDSYIYAPVTAVVEKLTKATLTRAQASNSMFTVRSPGHSFDFSNIIIDGAASGMMTEPNVNGGAVRIESGSSTISGVTLKNLNATGKGGAIYVGANATATVSNSAINGCNASQGAGIYLDGSGTLNLSGSLNFGSTAAVGNALIANTEVGNFVPMDAASLKADAADDKEPTNGGMQYPKGGAGYLVRQDIYLSGGAYTLAVTGKITAGNGTIWVWADDVSHYEMLKPFAAFSGDGTRLGSDDKESTMKAFRNAQPDSKTICGGDYLTGQSGAEVNWIYWTGGFDAVFMKVDSFGDPLPKTEFTLYSDPACTIPFEMTFSDGKRATAVSSDGTATYKDRDGRNVTLQEGEVLLSKVPPKTFYLKETIPAAGFDRDENKTTVYRIEISGQGGFKMYLGDTNTEVYKETRDGTERYVIMNIPEAERRVILKKVTTSYEPLEGAVFEIFRYDWTQVSSGGETSFTSGPSGVYFIGTLPYGTYYLHETTVPSDVTQNGTDGWWFTLTVKDGTIIKTLTQRATKTP